MPELPEVETIARGLRATCLDKVIEKLEVLNPSSVENPSQLSLQGAKIEQIHRKGKYLLFNLTHEGPSSPAQAGCLLLHLRMTGTLRYLAGGNTSKVGNARINKKTDDNRIEKESSKASNRSRGGEDLDLPYLRFLLGFTDGTMLVFQDIRKFGRLYLYPEETAITQAGYLHLGPDCLESAFTLPYLTKIIQAKGTRAIKDLLLDQRLMAGIGNIYSDEILFQARIRPDRLGRDMLTSEIETLYQTIIDKLQEGILAKGCSFRNYLGIDGKKGNFQQSLKVYQREGLPCFTCQSEIVKTKVGGRSSRYCPNCQK